MRLAALFLLALPIWSQASVAKAVRHVRVYGYRYDVIYIPPQLCPNQLPGGPACHTILSALDLAVVDALVYKHRRGEMPEFIGHVWQPWLTPPTEVVRLVAECGDPCKR